MGVLAHGDQRRLDLKSRQDVAIGRITRDRQPDPVTGLKCGEKGEKKGGRGASGYHDFLGIDRDPVLRLIMRGDRPAQRSDPESIGVADRLADKLAPGGLKYGFGRRATRL